LTNIKSLAEQYSYLHTHKPFKNPHYTKNTQRRVKNLKTILGQEREYEKTDRERCHQARVEAEAQERFRMDVDGEGVRSQTREDDEETATCVYDFSGQVHNNDCSLDADTSIEAPPSVLPQSRYCDITGLEVIDTLLVQLKCPDALCRHHTQIQQPAYVIMTRACMSISSLWFVFSVGYTLKAVLI